MGTELLPSSAGGILFLGAVGCHVLCHVLFPLRHMLRQRSALPMGPPRETGDWFRV